MKAHILIWSLILNANSLACFKKRNMILQNDVWFEVPLPLRPASLWSEGSCFTVKFTLTSLMVPFCVSWKFDLKTLKMSDTNWTEWCACRYVSASVHCGTSAPLHTLSFSDTHFSISLLRCPRFYLTVNRPLIYSDTVKQGCHWSKCAWIDLSKKE